MDIKHRILHHRPADNCSVGLRSWCNTYCLQPYTALFVFVFMAATLHFSFFKGFYYYSPCPKREIWPFLKVAISQKPKRSCPPKLACMHVTLAPTSINILSRFRSIKIFDDHGLYSPCPKRKIWLFLKGSHISETGEVTPTKIDVHARDIDPYLYEFFEPILIDYIFS